jgi:hypothetical protein
MSEEMTVCADCGAEIQECDAELCSECCSELCSDCLSADMLCADCSVELDSDLCDACGYELESYDMLETCPVCYGFVGPCCWDQERDVCCVCASDEELEEE